MEHLCTDDSHQHIDAKFADIFGLKRSQCIDYIKRVKLVAWEQVLLAGLYARSMQDNYFPSRLMLLKLAKKQEPRLAALISNWLDEGLSFFAIYERLNKDQPDEARFLTICEHGQIAFPASAAGLSYSHFTLLAALENIVEIFQALLSGLPADTWCDDIAFEVLDQHASPGLGRREPPNDILARRGKRFNSLHEALHATSEKPDELGTALTQRIDEQLGGWMSSVFDLFQHPCSAINGDHGGKAKKTKKICKTSQHCGDNNIVLTLDREFLTRCMALGQEDAVMSAIGKQLKDYIASDVLKTRDDRARKPQKTTPSLDRWYKKCGVLNLRREDSIPAKVAALLEFDIADLDYPFSFFYPYVSHCSPRKRLSTTDTATLTTAIIDRCLLHKETLLSICGNGIYFNWEDISEAVKSTPKTTDIWRDCLMKEWADREPKKINERFKRPRKQLMKDMYGVHSLVVTQKSQGMNTPYPVDGKFPLPLWA